jgi:hypothetical protein
MFRTYAQAIAGAPSSMLFDQNTGIYKLVFALDTVIIWEIEMEEEIVLEIPMVLL